MQSKPFISAYAAAIAVALSMPANADVLLDNLAEPFRAATVIQQDPDPTANPPVDLPWAAQSFLTHGDASMLDGITVLFGGLAGAPTPVLELRADNGGTSPDVMSAPLALFTFSPIPAGASAPVLLTPDRPVTLAAATTYWLVVGATGTGSYTWDYAQGNGFSGLPGAALANYAYSTDRGASWANFGSDNPYKLRTDVSPVRVGVPEPASAALLAAGALALGALRRRIG